MPRFVVTAAYDPNADRLPVPKGTTREDYYGTGPSILHGPGKEWRIERPYSFTFVRQEGARLFLRFEHHERIAHAFIGDRLEGNVFEPRNEGCSVLVDAQWKVVRSGGCYTAPKAFLLEPNKEYLVVAGLPIRSEQDGLVLKMRVDIDTGCWLNFESEPFDVQIPRPEPPSPEDSGDERSERADNSPEATPGGVTPAASAPASPPPSATQL